MSDWRIARKGNSCSVCARAFAPGESFVSAIFAAGEQEADESPVFSRVDACPGCAGRVEDAPFSRWVTRIPVRNEKKPLLDLGLAKEFLLRLLREGDPAHARIALVLTLLLLRKRKVKLRGEKVVEGVRVMDLTVPSEGGDMDVTVPAPEVGPEETEEITAELSRLFGLGGEEGKTEENNRTDP